MSQLLSLNGDDILKLQRLFTPPPSFSAWTMIKEILENPYSQVQLHKCTCGQIVIFDKDIIANIQSEFNTSPQASCWHLQGLLTSTQIVNHFTRQKFDNIGYAVNAQTPALLKLFAKGLLTGDTPESLLHSARRLQATMVISDYEEMATAAQKAKDHKYRAYSLVNKLKNKAYRVNRVELEKFSAYYSDPQNLHNILQSLTTAVSKLREAQNIRNSEAYYELSKSYSPSIRWESDKRFVELSVSSYHDLIEVSGVLEMVYSLILICNGVNFSPTPFMGKRLTNGQNVIVGNGHMNKKNALTKILQDCNNNGVSTFIRLAYDYDFRNRTSGHNNYDIDIKHSKIISRESPPKQYSLKYLEDRTQRVYGLTEALFNIVSTHKYIQNSVDVATRGIIAFSTGDVGTNLILLMQDWSYADIDPMSKIDFSLNIKFSSKTNNILLTFLNAGKKYATYQLPARQDYFRILQEAAVIGSIKVVKLWLAPRTLYFWRIAKRDVNDRRVEAQLGSDNYYIIGPPAQETERDLPIDKRQVRRVLQKLSQITLQPEPNGIPLDDFIRPVTN